MSKQLLQSDLEERRETVSHRVVNSCLTDIRSLLIVFVMELSISRRL